MRVGFNASILWGPVTGVGHYALSLLRALPTAAPDIEFVVFGLDPESGLLEMPSNIRLVPAGRFRHAGRQAWEQFELPRLAAREGVDVLHCPDFSRPLLCSVPVVNTIHDLSFYASKHYFPATKRVYKAAMAHYTVQRSALIAVSEFTRAELQRTFGISPDRVSVIYSGVDQATALSCEPASTPFILYVGTLEHRKNIVSLIDAYSVFRRTTGLPHRLLLVGARGFGWASIAEAATRSPFRNDIEMPGYLDGSTVQRLYQSADVFVYPSLYEGFGFPVLEAMAGGTPVVCSNASSIPEAGGAAAAYFDPFSPADLAEALDRVLSSADLRARMRAEGLRQAARFTWLDCARRHCRSYASVCGSKMLAGANV